MRTGQQRSSTAGRSEVLSALPAFSGLAPADLDRLAAIAVEERFAAGTCLVTEGEAGACAYLIVDGAAVVTSGSAENNITLATLGPGELFGEIALLTPAARRTATVTALRPTRALVIPGPAFTSLLADHPHVHDVLQKGADLALTARFLKLAASPFAALDPERFGRLTAKLEPLSIAAGTVLVTEGEPGDACFLLRSGEVEVVGGAGTPHERRLTTLGPGALFGEAALLTESPRNATVRALVDCDLLRLRRAGLLEAMGTEPVAAQLGELVQLRARPRQRPGVVAEARTESTGDSIVILKDRARGAYYRLSSEGWFIWQQLDGEHTLRDLTLAYLGEFKAFAPQAITEMLGRLAAAGFVSGLTVVASGTESPPSWQRVMMAVRRLLEWQFVIRGVDERLGRIYRTAVRPLYTRAAQIALALIAAAGVAAFFVKAAPARAALEHTGPRLLLFLIPAQLLALAIHEAGHAFTTKYFGREVLGVGVGWYWFGPVAFIDTSDMWLAGRWPRIAVSLAGPYTNLILGSFAALLALPLSGAYCAALWQLALASYLMVLVNLDPLLEYDGYYVVSDLLERPNLRPQSLRWLGRDFLGAMRSRAALREHVVELLYGIASIAYVASMAAVTLVLYRMLIQQWLAGAVPQGWAEMLAWVPVALVAGGAIIGVIADMRGIRPQQQRDPLRPIAAASGTPV